MEKYQSIPLELPNDYVQACNGFALDIGGLAKNVGDTKCALYISPGSHFTCVD